MLNVRQTGLHCAVTAVVWLLCVPTAQAQAQAQQAADPETLRTAIQVQAQTDSDAARSQAQIDRMAEQTREMFDEYRSAMEEIDQLRIYNEQMERNVAAQEREMASLQRQIDSFEQIERGITPLMVRMVDVLDRFVQVDAPFLPEERRNRVENIKTLMDDANVSVGERYRRLMEAYTIEMDYARNLDAYNGMLDFGGRQREVTFLRIGRLALLYQTLDRSETGYWDSSENGWVVLGDEYRTPVNDGIRMAQRLAAPDLIPIPITAPEAN